MSFPSNEQFQSFNLGAEPIYDFLGDENPGSVDIVGDSQFPAGYFAYDGENVFFRIRVNDDPVNNKGTGFRNFAWGVLVNTSGTPGVYDWLVNVNGLDSTINLIQNTDQDFNSWTDSAEGTDGSGAPNYSRPIVNFDVARAVLTNDGSDFGGDPDYFVDVQFSASVFFQTLGITENDPLQFIIFSSTNANNYNKDSLRTSEGFEFENAFSNPVAIEDGDIRAALDVTKVITSGPNSILNGEEGTWEQEVTVTNNGGSLARQIVVDDLIQIDQLTNVSNISATSGSPIYNSEMKTLSWDVGNINPGQTALLTYTVVGIFTNSGTQPLNTVTGTGVDDYSGDQLPEQTVTNTIDVQTDAAVTGQVISGQNGLPLTGVTVELRDSMNVLVDTVMTNGNGEYSLNGVAPGNYTVTFSYPDFMTVVEPVTLTSGEIEVVDVLLNPDPGSLSGTVTSAGSVPISGAEVRLIDSFNAVIDTSVTNAQGDYVFNTVSPGTYVLTVSAPTFQAETRGTTVEANLTTVEDFELAGSPATITGTVQSEASVPIPNATVEVLDRANNVITTTMTDGSGSYTIDELAAGTYTLRTSAPGYQTSFLGFTVEQGDTVTQDVTLVDQPGSLSGSITDGASGDAIEGATVQVVNQSGVTVASVLTDATGSYTVGNIPPGSYTVTISQMGYAVETVGAIISPGTATTLVAQLTRNAGDLEGVVENEAGQLLSNATVQLLLNGVAIASTLTNASGQFSFPNLEPGNYTVRASAVDYQTQVLGAQINEGEITVVDFSLLQQPGSLEGTIMDNSMGAIPGAVITARADEGNVVVATGVTDDTGFYTIPQLAPGTYNVTVTAQNYQSISQGVFIESSMTSTADFTLSPTPVSITGTVINSQTGDPLTGTEIEVRILDVNGAVIQTTFTDTNGDYLVDQLAPGTYTVFASLSGYQTNFSSVTIPPGGMENVIIGMIPNPGTVTGTINSQTSGDPVPGAVVKVIDQNNVQLDSVVADQNGQYTISGLPPGSYSIVASAEGFETKVGGAIVLSGSTSVVDLSLEEQPGIISGTVSPVQPSTLVQLYTAEKVFLASTIADANGNYVFPNLSPGNYIVSASAPDYTTVSAGAVVDSNQTTTIDLTLTANPASFSGTVLDEGGNPVTNATISVLDANEVPIRIAGTDANGFYSLSNLPAGASTIVVTAPGYSLVLSEIILPPGGDVTNVDFVLMANPGGISGEVTDDFSGNPLPNARVVIRESGTEDQAVATVTTDPFGNYTVTGLAPGSYTITASLEGYGTQTFGVTVISDVNANGNIALSQLRGSIEGQLVDTTGNSITGTGLQVRLLNELNVVIATALAQPDGSFLFESILPGNYIVTATVPGYQSSSVGVTVNSGQVTQTTVPMEAFPATLTGQVINENTGTGISGSSVSVSDPFTGNIVGDTFTDADGNFILKNLATGSFNVTASAPSFGSVSTSVVLESGQTTLVTLALSPNPGDVAGSVSDRLTGEALGGASVEIFDGTGAFILSTSTNALGNFRAFGLSPGGYTAKASLEGYSTQLIGFSVVSGETSIASFALDPAPATLQGTVTDIAGDPIPGAEVVVRQFTSTGPIIATAITETDGSYLVTSLPPGTFILIAKADGYAQETSSLILEPGSIVTEDFVLSQQTSTLEGTVTGESTGDPIENALVQIFDANGVLIATAQTGADGTYRLDGLSPGEYTASFSNPEYQPETIRFMTTPGQTVVVDAILGVNTGAIAGRVLDPEGVPLIGASVRVFPSLGLLPIATLVTDGTGSFSLSSLAPGSYLLVATFVNYSTGQTGVSVAPNETSSSTILLSPTPSSISGNVRSSSGEPIPNASVVVLDQNETVLESTVTDGDGNYGFSNLPPGNLQVIVRAVDYSSMTRGVILEGGDLIEDVDFVLEPNPGTVQGQVTDRSTGQPIVGAISVIRTVAGVPVIVASSATDENGYYLIDGLAPGSYSISSTAPGYAVTAVGAILESGQTTTVDISLSPVVGKIAGVVTDTEGMPILNAGIEIKVFDQEGILIETVLADALGEFSVPDLSPGTYTLSVTTPNYAGATVGVFVEAGGTTFVTIPLNSSPARVLGQVIDAETRSPIGGALVTVSDVSGLPITVALTDGEGNFSITGLPPSTVILSTVAANYGTSSTAVLLSPDATITTTLFLQPNPGGVIGVVTAEDSGDFIEGAVVRLFDSNGAIAATIVTDPDGAYQFSGLAAGKYRLVISAEGFGNAVQDIEVTVGQLTRADFSLSENPGSLEGLVLERISGMPIIGATVVIRALSPTGPIVQITATDSSGAFYVTGLTPGVYAVTAAAPLFGTQTASVIVSANTPSTVRLELSREQGTLEGVVTSSISGERLRDTSISVYGDSGELFVLTQTDDEGRYRVAGLEPGTYTVVFSHPSFQSLSLGASISVGQTTIVNADLDPVPGGIEGFVFDAFDEVPISGAIVQLFPVESLVSIAVAVTDQDGFYFFEGVHPGEYIVTASSNEYSSGSVGATVDAGELISTDLFLVSDPASISGIVTDVDGFPIQGATVRVLDPYETVVGTGITSADGFYIVGNLPSGAFTVIFRASGFEDMVSGVNLNQGEDTTLNAVLESNPGGITGIVFDSRTNLPLAGANLLIRRWVDGSSTVVASTSTDSNGRYTVQGLSPSVYTVTANADGYGTNVLPVVVEPDVTERVNLPLDSLVGAAAGQVVDAEGAPIAEQGVSIQVYDNQGKLLKTVLDDPSGAFTVQNLTPGDYVIVASAPGYGTAALAISITANQVTTVTIFLEDDPGTLSVKVIDNNTGETVPGANVTVTFPEGIVVGGGVTDSDGEVLISGLPVGDLNLSTSKENYIVDLQSITIEPGSVLELVVNLQPIPLGRVIGQIANEETTFPLAGAIIELVASDGTVLASTMSDEDGLFRFDDVFGGTYDLRISRSGYQAETLSIVVVEGETTYVREELQIVDPCVLDAPRAFCRLSNMVLREQGDPGNRESIWVQLPAGEEIEIQKITVATTFDIVITVEGTNGRCVSAPMQRTVCNQVLLCAPPSTEIKGTVSPNQCQVDLVCTNGNLNAAILHLQYYQSLQTQMDATIHTNGQVHSSRNDDMQTLHEKGICLNVTRVLDWIQSCIEREIRISADELKFACDFN
ncbi:carboxypeptidase regulatory-like domain-containing protein [Halobacillus sp. Nhm2S1]|uniref:carboxypeptidase regulatory-like domain-containing protein n=1 Tax=Halobacillus sp. Nhm2S1 TaxID=2866716 RepID=UPI001C72C9A0|nr:carboxypeptidase regulatory-like domain-containing protein [Halobacillus sp. Nhm2S1]MBX0356899.1 carboxypeptidase regulatory-like domain-containing protein [Halobacillus sp. Nhm2S1]